MISIQQQLTNAFKEALQKILPPDYQGPTDPMVRLTTEKAFGDFQANGVMAVAKQLKTSPRKVAEEVVKHLDLGGVCDRVEIAGPGFINLFLSPHWLAEQLTAVAQDSRLGVSRPQKQVLHIIDFSSPNLAKEMHVGHLRTTITGEVIARVIEFMGHPVERVNHVGDWGTQFGMLLEYIFREVPDVLKTPEAFQVADLQEFYRKAKEQFDADPAFAEAARQKVVLLQSEDPVAIKVWRAFVAESLRHCHAIYEWLDVTLTDVGESFYNSRLGGVVTELKQAGMAREDQGAVCVFLEGFVNREGAPLPMIIQKTDGGYNYDTTDLAAIKYRILERGGQRLIYITDIRQAQHFTMLFVAARAAGWAEKDVVLDHVGYGMVLGPDRKPFKTRDGGTVLLKDLIHEGIERARQMVLSNRSGAQAERVARFSPEQIEHIARTVGIAAIKYADLSHNLASDYVFSWDKMLAMDGNTGPYMLYAYARIKSIGRKGGVDFDALPADTKLLLLHETETELAKVLLRFGDVVTAVFDELKPNLLTDYLFELSKTFNGFYDKKAGVSVLEAGDDALRLSRLLLCALTARTLKLGLGLLSINVVEEM